MLFSNLSCCSFFDESFLLLILGKNIRKYIPIGIATVYRIIKSLEEIGAINRKNLYKISSEEIDILNGEGIVVLKNKKTFKLSEEDWKRIIRIGLYEAEGLNINDIDSIVIKKVNDGEEEIM